MSYNCFVVVANDVKTFTGNSSLHHTVLGFVSLKSGRSEEAGAVRGGGGGGWKRGMLLNTGG